MDVNSDRKPNIIKHIMEVAPKHCENCGNKYSETDFKVMKSTSVNTLLHLKCSSCGNTYMLNVVSPMQGMVGASRTPLNLDLQSSNEFSKFAGNKPTKIDEAIDIYEITAHENFSDFLSQITS